MLVSGYRLKDISQGTIHAKYPQERELFCYTIVQEKKQKLL